MTMRIVLAAQLTITVLLFGSYIGLLFREYTTGQRITVVGLFCFTVYGLSSQFKAMNLHIPFDAYSWSGLASVTIINAGLGWSLWERRPRKRA